MLPVVLIATSNTGKLRDFAGAASLHGIAVSGIPDFQNLTQVEEDGETFEANARKKAEAYSLHAAGEVVLADDSGLVVDALDGAPGLHSARYAALGTTSGNASDEANNTKLLKELATKPDAARKARFVCVLAAARDGKTLAIFDGVVEGQITDTPRGSDGFGYDPLFYVEEAGKTFAEMGPDEKSKYSHRGAAFRKFLQWAQETNLH
jgi:XTP/dITP diphosphohydrolase